MAIRDDSDQIYLKEKLQNHSPKHLEFLLWLGLAIACSFAYSPSFLVPEVSWQIHENSEGCSQRLQKSFHWNNLNCRNLYYYISVVSFSFVTTYLPIRWIKPDKWPLGRKRGVWGSIMGSTLVHGSVCWQQSKRSGASFDVSSKEKYSSDLAQLFCA